MSEILSQLVKRLKEIPEYPRQTVEMFTPERNYGIRWNELSRLFNKNTAGKITASFADIDETDKIHILESYQNGTLKIASKHITGCLGVREFNDAGNIIKEYSLDFS